MWCCFCLVGTSLIIISIRCYHICLHLAFYQSLIKWRDNLFMFMRILILKWKLQSDLKFLSTFCSLLYTVRRHWCYIDWPTLIQHSSNKKCVARVLSLLRCFLSLHRLLLLSSIFSLSSNLWHFLFGFRCYCWSASATLTITFLVRNSSSIKRQTEVDDVSMNKKSDTPAMRLNFLVWLSSLHIHSMPVCVEYFITVYLRRKTFGIDTNQFFPHNKHWEEVKRKKEQNSTSRNESAVCTNPLWNSFELLLKIDGVQECVCVCDCQWTKSSLFRCWMSKMKQTFSMWLSRLTIFVSVWASVCHWISTQLLFSFLSRGFQWPFPLDKTQATTLFTWIITWSRLFSAFLRFFMTKNRSK